MWIISSLLMEQSNVIHGATNINTKHQLENARNVILCVPHVKIKVQIIAGVVGKVMSKFQVISQLLEHVTKDVWKVHIDLLMDIVKSATSNARLVKDLQKQIVWLALSLAKLKYHPHLKLKVSV